MFENEIKPMSKNEIKPMSKSEFLQVFFKTQNIVTTDTLTEEYNNYLLEFYGYK